MKSSAFVFGRKGKGCSHCLHVVGYGSPVLQAPSGHRWQVAAAEADWVPVAFEPVPLAFMVSVNVHRPEVWSKLGAVPVIVVQESAFLVV